MDKTEKLLRMMEHPEKYSDEELQELLSDEECRQLYEAMRLSADAFEMADAKEQIANGIKDSEWEKFEAEHFSNEESTPFATHSSTSTSNYSTSATHSSLFTLHSSLRKIAAMFVGVLMLSGIAYAAFYLVRNNTQTTQNQQTAAVAGNQPSIGNAQLVEEDSTQLKPVVYEDAELCTMLSEMAAFYHYEVTFRNDSTKHIRLYFTWDKNAKMEDVIATFNKFDRIHITCEEQKLTVE